MASDAWQHSTLGTESCENLVGVAGGQQKSQKGKIGWPEMGRRKQSSVVQ